MDSRFARVFLPSADLAVSLVERADALGGARVLVRDLVALAAVDEALDELWGDAPSDDDSPMRLADRLESATVIGLRAGSGSAGDLARVRRLLARLNPDALIGPDAVIGGVDALPRLRTPDRAVVAGLAHRQAASLGWQCELEGGGGQWAEGVDAVVFRDPRPFHPQRLAVAIERDLDPARHGRILRSRGVARIASRPGAVASWASAGARLRLDRFGDDDGSAPAGAELVLFGEGLDRAGLVAALGACVLTAEELLAGPEAWRALDDPLPAW